MNYDQLMSIPSATAAHNQFATAQNLHAETHPPFVKGKNVFYWALQRWANASAPGENRIDAMKNIESSAIKKLFITDTVAHEEALSPKIEVVSVAGVFAEAIERIDSGESLSELFETD